ncbi:hypothetical protein JB92DRAFT_23443 [Gautieria morchelliformis]|nr:hypothetical protein JB92DRAFT_23443 [Gautieria morchelliformis]
MTRPGCRRAAKKITRNGLTQLSSPPRGRMPSQPGSLRLHVDEALLCHASVIKSALTPVPSNRLFITNGVLYPSLVFNRRPSHPRRRLFIQTGTNPIVTALSPERGVSTSSVSPNRCVIGSLAGGLLSSNPCHHQNVEVPIDQEMVTDSNAPYPYSVCMTMLRSACGAAGKGVEHT